MEKKNTEKKKVVEIAQPKLLNEIICDVKGSPVGGYGLEEDGKTPKPLTIEDALLGMLQTVDVGNALLSFKLAVKIANEDITELANFNKEERAHLIEVVTKAGSGTLIYVRGFLENFLRTGA